MASASRKLEREPSVAYPNLKPAKCATSTKVALFGVVLFALIAIIRSSNTSDSRFKWLVGLVFSSCLLRLLSTANVGNKIFRTAVLQEGVRKDGCLENGIITIYRKCNRFNDFDPRRAEETYQALKLIHFQPTQVKLDEPSRELDTLEFDSNAFEKTIVAAGGQWVKRETQFVIIPPKDQISVAWENFEKGIQKFHWRKEKDVIVTCDNADSIQDEHRRLFIYASSSHAILNVRRAGFYLGCKQSVLIYSPSGCGRSTGYASEGQHYADSLAIYGARVKGRFEPQFVWFTASCGDCPTIVHLKSRLNELPFNLILESGFADLQQDFIDPQGVIVKNFASAHWNALSSPIPSQQVFETRYNLDKIVANRQLAGRVVIVTVANDQRLKPDVADRMERIFTKACGQVLHVKFHAEGANPHSSRYFFYPDTRRKILEFIQG